MRLRGYYLLSVIMHNDFRKTYHPIPVCALICFCCFFNSQRSRRERCSIEVIPNSSTGEVDVSLLTASLKRGGVAAVVISHMPMYQGVINPAEEVDRFLSLQKQKLGQYVLYLPFTADWWFISCCCY